MKKTFVYRIKSQWFWRLRELKRARSRGSEIWVWGDQVSRIPGSRALRFPSAALCVPYEEASRKRVADYFRKHAEAFGTDPYRLDYLRKSIDVHFLDYYAFRRTVDGEDPARIGKVVSPELYAAIYEDRLPRANPWNGITGIRALAYVSLVFVRACLIAAVTPLRMEVPPILFLRKKVYPDLGVFSTLADELNSGSDRRILGVFPLFSRQKEKYGFYFLNAIRGCTVAAFRAYCRTMRAFLELPWFLRRGIPDTVFYSYLKDTFFMATLGLLKPKVITGILVDKPAYVLLKKHGVASRVASLNESFFFPPSRSFDYNHLDTYYSMNEIDERMQNLNGGNISRFKRVEFFRDLPSTSRGISSRLQETLDRFSYRVVLAPAQVYVERTGFYYWAYEELEKFLRSSLEIASSMPDTLFIIKGKKGELRLLPSWFHEQCEAKKNVFVIYCDRPRDLEFNQLEDLIPATDLLVSMCHTSTTIWQAIARGKPAIAVNDIHPPTFLRQHPGFECTLTELRSVIEVWKSLAPSERDARIQEMKEAVNLGEGRGLMQIADDLKQQISPA